MPKVNNSDGDFIYWLGTDISIKILTHLDDPSDIVCVSSVSKLWHQFGESVVLNCLDFDKRVLCQF